MHSFPHIIFAHSAFSRAYFFLTPSHAFDNWFHCLCSLSNLCVFHYSPFILLLLVLTLITFRWPESADLWQCVLSPPPVVLVSLPPRCPRRSSNSLEFTMCTHKPRVAQRPWVTSWRPLSSPSVRPTPTSPPTCGRRLASSRLPSRSTPTSSPSRSPRKGWNFSKQRAVPWLFYLMGRETTDHELRRVQQQHNQLVSMELVITGGIGSINSSWFCGSCNQHSKWSCL